MNRGQKIVCDWALCEVSGRWTAALRVAVERRSRPDECQHRLHESRSIAELSGFLVQRPTSLAAIEVSRSNLGDVLQWLSAHSRDSSQGRSVALLDRSLQAVPWDFAALESTPGQDVSAALREAGAVDVVLSPRRIESLLELGRRHAESTARQPAGDVAALTLAARAWASLPWQAT